jgi:methylglutaconyl-CoA hydratase
MPNPIADPLVPNVIVDDVASVVTVQSTPEGVATVTLNRPEDGNGLNTLLIEGLTEAFETLQGADHVRVVFLRGAGADFCVGGDPIWSAQAAEMTEADNRDDAMTVAVMLKALTDIPALTVALVQGRAFGGGIGLMAACDAAVAQAGASFAFPEVRAGLIPAMVAPYVVDAIGTRQARSLFTTGRTLDAARAEQIGLVDEVAQSLDEAASRLTAEAMSAAPGAVADAKRLVTELRRPPIDHRLMEDMARRLAARRISDEGREGMTAYAEGRKPGWAR